VVLDAWADAFGTQWHSGQGIAGFKICRLQADGTLPELPKEFGAESAESARIAAANWLCEKHPRLFTLRAEGAPRTVTVVRRERPEHPGIEDD
jgi:hypothetical protein